MNAIQSTSASTAERSEAKASTSDKSVTKDMFLQLLVAQIKNQDPLNPSDGVEFLSQLAQFQQMEQGINISEDLSAVREAVEKLAEALENTQETQAA